MKNPVITLIRMCRKIRRERLDAVTQELALEDRGYRRIGGTTAQRDPDYRDDDFDWSPDDESGPLW
jgi:hypothetical protein